MFETLKRFRARKGLLWRFIRREEFFLSFKGLLALLAATCIVWLVYAIFVSITVTDWEKRGQSGDMFGGITALFSGLAFAGLVYTLFVQKKELQYQREELARLVEEQAEFRVHLAAQAQYLEAQHTQMSQQTFENTFFALLSQFREFKQSISWRDETGQKALNKVCKYVIPSDHFMGEMHARQSIQPNKRYLENYNNSREVLAPYFRHIFNILKFVKMSGIQNAKTYTNFLRADLNHLELAALCLNGSSEFGREKMAPLLKEYDFLKHFDTWKLFESDVFNSDLPEFYSEFAFYQKRQKDREAQTNAPSA